jgi:hypothetical protein
VAVVAVVSIASLKVKTTEAVVETPAAKFKGTVETMVGWAWAGARARKEVISASQPTQRPAAIHRSSNRIFFERFSNSLAYPRAPAASPQMPAVQGVADCNLTHPPFSREREPFKLRDTISFLPQ